MPDFTNNNTRVHYPMYAVAMGAMGAGSVVDSWGVGDAAISAANASGAVFILHGLQEIDLVTNFGLEGINEIGQLSLYENVEDVPDIQINMTKFLDGYTHLYHAATPTATSPTLTGRADSRADVRIVIGLSTADRIVSGAQAVAEMYASGCYISSCSYALTTDGTFAHSIGLVGNNKKTIKGTADSNSLLISSGNGIINSAFNVFGNDYPNSPDSGVMRRENIVTGTTGKSYNGVTFKTVVPNFIQGVTGVTQAVSSSTSTVGANTINTDNTHVGSININVDLNREAINQLGTRLPYSRYINFPVPVNTDITLIATGGDNINALENSVNLSNHTIQLVLDDTTVIQLGHKNKISSVNWGGGSATGGNVNISVSMTNNNDLAVLHSGDPALSIIGAGNYWKDHFA